MKEREYKQLLATVGDKGKRKGWRVKVVEKSEKRNYGKTLHACGTIQNISGGSFGVLLDNFRNSASGSGLFWYHYSELKILDNFEMEETNMKLTGFNKVAVIEMEYGTYYFALYDKKIEAGDTVLVSGAAQNKLHTVSEVISVEDARSRYSKEITAEVICKVDMTDYEKRVADRKEAEKFKNEMNRVIKQMDEVNKYEVYAQNNPALAEMLCRYKELVG